MSEPSQDDFFIGWAKSPPRALKPLLAAVAATLILGFVGLALAIGAAKPDPGPGAFRFDWGRQTVEGVVAARPYPTLTVVKGAEHIPVGHTIMLVGQGKRGVQSQAEALDGQLAEASGVVLKRGELDMLQARGGPDGLKAAEADAAAAAPAGDAPLGRWRLTGEVCDGKCLAGAMRPGAGLAHKACANLCLYGGAPPVFVSAGPVEGEVFFLLADADGGPVGEALYDLVGRLTTLEGEIVRRGDLLIFQADIDRASFPK